MTDIPMIVASDSNRSLVGFISIKRQTKVTFDAYVLGVKKGWHGMGIGRRLFNVAEEMIVSQGGKFLTVKTLAESHPDVHYKKTRLFYEHIGFLPVEVFPTLWSHENPCLLMIKSL